MIDPERIGESFADQTQGSLPTGLGADGLAARHQRRVRRRRAVGGVAALAIVAGGAFVLPNDSADDEAVTETAAATETDDVTTPTTEDPVKVEEAEAGAEAQSAALADGEVSEAEYEEAITEFRACTERLDEADCYDFHVSEIDDLIREAGVSASNGSSSTTETVESILVPGGEFSVTSVNTLQVEPDPRLIALATTEFGASGPLLRVSLDYGQVIDSPDGVTALETPGQAIVYVNRIEGIDVAVEGIGVDAATVEAVAAGIVVTDGMVAAPETWPEGFTAIAPDLGLVTQELVVAEGPAELSIIATDGSTRYAQDAIAGTRARSASERRTEIGLVTDTITFIANGHRLYLIYTTPENSDLAVTALEPIEVDQLRTELDLPDRAATYAEWLASTPLPDDHGLEELSEGLTIDVGLEGPTAHSRFQCAWIERWVDTGDPTDLAPLDGRDAWPTAEFVAALPDGEQLLYDVAQLLLGDGETFEERATDPAAQICRRIG